MVGPFNFSYFGEGQLRPQLGQSPYNIFNTMKCSKMHVELIQLKDKMPASIFNIPNRLFLFEKGEGRQKVGKLYTLFIIIKFVDVIFLDFVGDDSDLLEDQIKLSVDA